MPKVSVIVPNYNHAVYLNERINSILSQTYKDFELILMDDNSSDNSRQILESYRSLPNVKIVFNEENSGSSFKQWNKGVRLSSGEYIWIAESDDSADTNFLSTLVSVLGDNAGVALAYAQSYEINTNGYITGNWFDHTKMLDTGKWASDFIIRGNEMIKKYMIHDNCVPNASGALFRRDKMEAIGMADETFRLNGDWLFWVKLMENSSVAFIAKPLNYFRTHGSTVRSLTKNIGLGLYEYSLIIKYIVEQLEFEKTEKRKIVLEFFNKLQLSPLFYSWKIEPQAFKYVSKSYFNLMKVHKLAYWLFIKHMYNRFFIYHIRVFGYNNFKKPLEDFFQKRTATKRLAIKIEGAASAKENA